jgi:TrmH family RNA methyltransferase
VISSATNPRLKRARRLQGRRARSLLGLFTAEGEDLLEAALQAGIAPVEVLAVPGAGLPVSALDVEPELRAAVGTRGHPARVLATFATADLPAAPAAADVALELHGVRDPGNVGTLLRSLAAFGPGVAVLRDGCADPTGPRAVRASMGALFSVPVTAEPPPGLRVALTAGGDAELAELDLRGPVTFLVGAERTGVPVAVAYDVTARIPQAAAIDSLNAAMAGTVALYEARRQRGS